MKIYGLKLHDIVAPPKRLVLGADPIDLRRARDELGLERAETRKTEKTERTEKLMFSINWKARFSASIRGMSWRKRDRLDEDRLVNQTERRSVCILPNHSDPCLRPIVQDLYAYWPESEYVSEYEDFARPRSDSFKENIPPAIEQSFASRRVIAYDSEPLTGHVFGQSMPSHRHRRPLSDIEFEPVVARAL